MFVSLGVLPAHPMETESMTLSNTINLEENKRIGLQRLANAPVNTDNIFIPLKNRTKKCVVDFTQEHNRINGSQINQNYAVLAKGQLHFIDIDDREEAPDKLLNETVDTFSVSSPHGEHRWIVCKDVLPNKNPNWGEIRSENQYVVGPGSMLKDCDNDCCSTDNPGIYSVKNDAPIQEVSKDELSDWVGGFEKETVEGFSDSVGLDSLSEGVDELQEAQEVLSKLKSNHRGFYNDVFDRLNGGRGNMGDALTVDEGSKIDTSQLDFVTLEHLYGIFKQYGYSHKESRSLTQILYSHFADANPYTKDGQLKKWNKRDNQYRRDMVDNAIYEFGENKFTRLLNQSTGKKGYLDEYSDITFNCILFAIDWLMCDENDTELAKELAKSYNLVLDDEMLSVVSKRDMYQDTPRGGVGDECPYPTLKSVRELCVDLDNKDESSIRKAMKTLRNEYGETKMACLVNGVDYRYYHEYQKDPLEAEHIRHNGKKYSNSDKTRASNSHKSNNVKKVNI